MAVPVLMTIIHLEMAQVVAVQQVLQFFTLKILLLIIRKYLLKRLVARVLKATLIMVPVVVVVVVMLFPMFYLKRTFNLLAVLEVLIKA